MRQVDRGFLFAAELDEAKAVVGVKNGGVTQYFLTAADALSTLADSVARGAAAKTRATTDALSSLSEVASRVLGFLRTSADSLSSGSIVRQSYQTGSGVPSGAGPYTHTVTYPSGVTVDDYLVLNIGFNGGPGTVSLAADGWTLMASAVGQTNPDFYMYGRKATAAWSGGFTYTTSNGIYTGYILARYSGVDTSTPQDTTDVGTDGAQADRARYRLWPSAFCRQ